MNKFKGDAFMKKSTKKLMALMMTVMMISFAFVGCGTDTDSTTMTTEQTTGTTAPDGAGNPTTGDRDGVVGDMAEGVGNAVGDVANGVGDAVGDVANGVGNAVGDVADGVGNAIGDGTTNGFQSYEDAHDYLLGKLGTQDNNASYEVRNMEKETVVYQDGKKGYKFEVYDTRDGKDKKFGTFFVDEKDGKVYKSNENGNGVTSYTFS